MVCVHKRALRFTNTIGLDSYLVQVSMGFEPERDCVKTIFNFRKLLSLWRSGRGQGRVFTYKTQFLETNLTFHTLSFGFKFGSAHSRPIPCKVWVPICYATKIMPYKYIFAPLGFKPQRAQVDNNFFYVNFRLMTTVLKYFLCLIPIFFEVCGACAVFLLICCTAPF